MTKIFGITLVKDENIFIERVLKNIYDFCDEIMVLDNHSTDGTYEIVESMTKEFDNLYLMRWDNPANSGQAIEHLVGEDCWVFGVDGDEIYDPVGLRILREDILSGKYDDVFHLRGHCLHCNDIDEEKMCSGWLDARPMDKLYNFSIVEWWNQGERLHGLRGMKGGVEENKVHLAKEQGGDYSWDDSPLRCVHACFLQRSSLQENSEARPAPLISGHDPNWKNKKYVGKNLIKKHAPFI